MPESNRIEYKQELTDNLEKEVVAFLNYQGGGNVYLGINKNDKTLGLENINATQLQIKDRFKNNISPSCLGFFDVEIENQQNIPIIIKLTMASDSEKPYYFKKQVMSPKNCFIKIGSASEPMSVFL